MFAPTKARQAFNTAENELEQAIKKYNEARAALQRETGDFIATDKNTALQFSSATGVNAEKYEATDC